MKRVLVLFVALLSLAYLAALGIALYTPFLCPASDVTERWLGERAEIVSSHTIPNGGIRMLRDFSLPVMFLGPAIPVDAALLLLMPFGSRRRLLWYLLPLVHAGILVCVCVLSALQEGEPFMCIFAPILALFRCPVSLLQSLLFGGLVPLCCLVSEKAQSSENAC